ncbi:uncharacterized protein LOC106133722 [Amyelois transitella]|uniref:uncharacterized protein LOC106133722 n=1 Tax=Amyelois transitella TaxID=680683 RepID=UPI00067CEB6E|nr:uncharacterized protein LOC106133722 [Amyelois transitella]XP_060808271.1 uncharacterized protein LOC106133722 [Amyelois transitella]
MFQYEFEKRPPSSTSCESRATMTTDWSRVYPNAGSSGTSGANRSSGVNITARRPLPPRPIICESIPAKPSVPLKVWIVASASCFAVCAALVLATVVITKWGASQTYTEQLFDSPEPVYSNKNSKYTTTENPIDPPSEDDIQMPILEKLPIFKNAIANRDRKPNLASKPQIHPLHESIDHEERKIEKKDQPKLPYEDNAIPDFKPTLPDIFINKHKDIKLSDGYIAGLRKHDDYEDYYNDENLYDDYLQSNTMTSYLIEKVQELHNWITSDPDFVVKNNSKRASDQFGQVLKALNDSLLEGNVSIVMTKLRDIYFGDNYTMQNSSRKIISTNSTDLLSFGILSLDVMLLHNIQLMAWENQEATRIKMLKDPDIFAFNALFMDPTKVEAVENELANYHHDSGSTFTKRQNLRQQDFDDFNIGKTILENFLEIGMSTARAAIHLGRAYKNTKNVLNHLQSREQTSLSRNVDGNAQALQHLQSSLKDSKRPGYTELDCVWLLYCRNLVASSKLHPPYATMARINGLALRMLTGELPADRALDTMLYEAFSGWTELKCNDMFPRCSKANAAAVVLETIMQPLRKSQARTR